jgi:hypothetical protein
VSEPSSFDPTHVAIMAVVIVLMIAVLIVMIPLLFNAVWQILPGVAIVMLIVGVFRGFLKKLFD